MRAWLVVALLAVVITAGPAVAAKSKKPQRGHMGSEWVGKDGDTRRPQLGLMVAPPAADPTIYRSVEFDWRRSSIQTGPYPPQALKAETEAVVPLKLTISADGKLLDCKVTGTSGAAELDAHACPHLKRYAHFHPALNVEGKRIESVVTASLSYEIRLYVQIPSPFNALEAVPTYPAKANSPITADTLGISVERRKRGDLYNVGAWVTVGPDGKPSRCWLSSPTFVDDIDALVCNKLMKEVSYTPARNQSGQAVEDRVSVFVALRSSIN